jgi:hypothetical protein
MSTKAQKIKLRFHLAKGPHYQRWQIRTGDNVDYLDPEDVTIEMQGATLRNQRKTAERIRSGENKSVCAWVECDELIIEPSRLHAAPRASSMVSYNPRKEPHWTNINMDDLDNKRFDRLVTYGRLIIIPS